MGRKLAPRLHLTHTGRTAPRPAVLVACLALPLAAGAPGGAIPRSSARSLAGAKPRTRKSCALQYE